MSTAIPERLLRAMRYDEVQDHLRQVKRTRRRFISYSLNGWTTLRTREEAIVLAQARLQQLEFQR